MLSTNDSSIMNIIEYYKLIDSLHKLIEHSFYENRNPMSLSRQIFQVCTYFLNVKYASFVSCVFVNYTTPVLY